MKRILMVSTHGYFEGTRLRPPIIAVALLMMLP